VAVATAPAQTLKSVPHAPGGFAGLDRWIFPQRFIKWTDAAPDRYVVDMPWAPKVLLTCSPEDCRTIFAERDGALLFGEGLRRMAPHEAMFGHDALEALDGAEHTRVRRLLTSAFHGDALKGYERGIVEVTERHLNGWPIGTPVRFADLARDLGRDVIAHTVFGVTEPGRARRLQFALDRLDKAVNSLEMSRRFATAIVRHGKWAPYPAMDAIHDAIAQVTLEEIAARRATPGSGGDDCLERFLNIEATEDGVLSDDEIVQAMRVLVIAGWATTANTLAWIAERLARNPGALASCHQDVREGGGGRYLIATVQEALRMRPPVPFTLRYVARDFDLDGLHLPAGTLLATDIERMHYRPDIYPEPRSFRPERFIDGRPGTYTWIPFGGGVHRCIGAGFALTEARLILQTVLERLTFAPAAARGERSRRTNLVTAPAGGATVTLQSA
jgi:cytochrome P450